MLLQVACEMHVVPSPMLHHRLAIPRLRHRHAIAGFMSAPHEVSIKANSLRKLEVGDVVEVLGPPTKVR